MEKLLSFLYSEDEKIIDITSIDYWRQVFFAVVAVAISLGVLILIFMSPGLMEKKVRATWLLFIVLIYLVCILVTFNKRIPKYFRYIFMVGVLYGAGLMMLFIFYNHLIGDMYILLAFVVGAIVLSNEDLTALIIVNIMVMACMSILYEIDYLPGIPSFASKQHWYFFLATLLIFTHIIVILVSRLLRGLEAMIGEMKRGEVRLKTIFNSMPSGVIMLDSNGYIIDINSYMQEKISVTKKGVLHRHIDEIANEIMPKSKQIMPSLFEALMGADAYQEVVIEDELGHIYLNCHMTRLHVHDESHKEYVVIVHDVTAVRDAASGAVHSSKMEAIGTIAGGIAHDFNNMLGGILGYAELNEQLITQSEGPASIYNQKIIDAAMKASSLTKQLLTYARKEEIVRNEIIMNESIVSVISLMERTFEKWIVIESQLTDDVSIVDGDVGMLENALLNIGINARDAMQQGERLRITTEQVYLDRSYCASSDFDLLVGNYIMIVFSDEGEGMSQEISKRVFEPFFTTKEVGKGTGLGLSTAYGTVVAHHGEIKIQSEIGKGTQIEVLLPLRETNASDLNVLKHYHDAEESVYKKMTVEKKPKGRILIVDDEAVIRGVLAGMIKMVGYEVIEAEDGEIAMEIFESSPYSFDAVFLDMIMPNVSGKDVLIKMKKIRADIDIAIISGYMKDEKVHCLYNEGADVILSKPFSLQQVTEVVERWQRDKE